MFILSSEHMQTLNRPNSVLGPLLFVIFINSIIPLTKNSKMLLFADNTLLLLIGSICLKQIYYWTVYKQIK